MKDYSEGFARLSRDLDLVQENEKLKSGKNRNSLIAVILAVYILILTIMDAIEHKKGYDRGWNDCMETITKTINEHNKNFH